MFAKRNITRLTRVSGNILMLVSLFFIVRGIVSSNVNLSTFLQFKILVTTLCLAVTIAAGICLMALAWKYIIETVSGNKQSYLDIASVYTRSNLGKYLPGNVMHMIMRNTMGKQIRAHQAEIAFSTFLELGVVAMAGFFCAIILSWRDLSAIVIQYRQAYYIPAILGVVVVLLLFSLGLIWRGKVIVRIKSIKLIDAISASLICLVCYGFMIILLGLVMAVNLACYIPLSFEDVLRTLAAYSISWLIGFVVIGAPGGLGVREAALLFLMNGICEQDILLTATVLNRITTTLGDLFAGLGGISLEKYLSRIRIESQPSK